MGVNKEDLYLKGFLAFSEKKYKIAKECWERVLEIDPGHQKAKRGMAELRALSSKKRTSKEILQEIKRFYAAKDYQEAHKLCRLLVKKHPTNKDLQGLLAKIENRLRAGTGGTSPQSGSFDPNSTGILANRAEASVDESDSIAEKVESLIQEGVGLYEVQDYEMAIKTWEKALALDPDNRIARDYIANVRSFLEDNQPQAVPEAPRQPAASNPVHDTPAGTGSRPDKASLMKTYQEGMELFKQKKYTEAKKKWQFILQYHPNHNETRICLEKTDAAMAKNAQYGEKLEEARQELASGNHHAAERIVTQLSIEAPDLEGLDNLREAIQERQRQITEIRSMEIEAEDALGHDEFTATDDEITRYFTPDAHQSAGGAQQVSEVVVVKQPTKSRKWLWVGLPLVLILLGGGGYFGYEYYQQQFATGEEPAMLVPLVREVDWNSAQRRAEDFNSFGNDFKEEGDLLLANYSYRRTLAIATPRVEELRAMDDEVMAFEINDELTALSQIVVHAQQQLSANPVKASEGEIADKERELERARVEFNRGLFHEAADRLAVLLNADPENESLREKLAEAQEKLAVKKVVDGELDEAAQYFRKTAVLKAAYEMPRRHVEVIQRFFSGKISVEEKDQWFFFFTE